MPLIALARRAGVEDPRELVVTSLQPRGILREATLAGSQVADARSLLALKGLPLLLPLRGVIKRDLYTLQWSSMVILIYFVEGAVRAWSDKTEISRLMALGEVLLVFSYFEIGRAHV